MPISSRILAASILLLASCARATTGEVGVLPPPVTPGLGDGTREQTADQQVIHALNRLAFGPRPGDAARVRAMGVDRWMASQLAAGHTDGETERLIASYETVRLSPSELLREYPPPFVLRAEQRREKGQGGKLTAADSARYREAQRRSARVMAELVSSRVARAVASERQLDEVMVDFWENHFNVFAGKGGPMRYYLASYDREVIRPHAMGRFRDLLGAVAKSPAMLYYLDNWQSVADSGRPVLARGEARGARGEGRAMRGRGTPGRGRPVTGRRPGRAPAARAAADSAMPARPARRRGLNENYGRELLELHTVGVDGGYTQQDVIDVARAFTGWTIETPRQGGGFVFRPAVHDAGAKTVLGHALRAHRGIDDGEQVLDIVARHPATARFIALKLSRRFVSDTPPPALVDRVAATFTRTDGDIREVMRTIIGSPEFFSAAAYRSKVKSPFELVVSALRVMGARPDTTPRTAQLVAILGQPPFGHQAPNGWPETGESWMNAGAILNRINFGLALAAGRVPGVSVAGWPEAAVVRDAPRAQQVDAVIRTVLAGAASPDTREILLTGAHPMLAVAPTDSAMRDMAGRDSLAVAALDPPDEMADVGPMTGAPMADGPMPRQARRGGGRGAGMRALPELTGLAQILGLALGAPEFQRR